MPGRSDPILLPEQSPGLQLLQRIRDEAHRFAITFHRQRRDAAARELDVRPARGRRPGAPARAAAALRLGRARRGRVAGGARGSPGVPAQDRAARSTTQLHKTGARIALQPPSVRPLRGGSSASRNFGPYFVGNAASASGTWFQNLAASILVFRLTHSPFLLGVLNFCQFVPVLLLSPWAGSIADRVDRKRLLLITQVVATRAQRGARRARVRRAAQPNGS